MSPTLYHGVSPARYRHSLCTHILGGDIELGYTCAPSIDIPLQLVSLSLERSAIRRSILSLGSASFKELSEAANEMGRVWGKRGESALELRDARYESRLGLVQKVLLICEGRMTGPIDFRPDGRTDGPQWSA